MTLGESIYYYRKRSGLSQEALAERVGVSRQAVSRWELDDATPEVAKLKTLAEAFHITVDQLLSGEEPAPPAERYTAPGTAVSAPRSTAETEKLPGILGRMIRRHGWIAGIYIMLQGLGVALVGGIARYAFSQMFRVAVGSTFGMGGWATSVVDNMGNPVELPPEVMGDLFGGLGQATVVSEMGQVFLNIAAVIMVLGILVAIAGAVLAAMLYRKGKKA